MSCSKLPICVPSNLQRELCICATVETSFPAPEEELPINEIFFNFATEGIAYLELDKVAL